MEREAGCVNTNLDTIANVSVGAGAEAALGDGEGALHKAAAWIAHGLQGDGQ